MLLVFIIEWAQKVLSFQSTICTCLYILFVLICLSVFYLFEGCLMIIIECVTDFVKLCTRDHTFNLHISWVFDIDPTMAWERKSKVSRVKIMKKIIENRVGGQISHNFNYNYIQCSYLEIQSFGTAGHKKCIRNLNSCGNPCGNPFAWYQIKFQT